MMAPRVLCTRPLTEKALALLQRHFEVDTYENDAPMPRAELLARVQGCEGLVCMLSDKVDGELFDRAPGLRAVANVAVGYDNVDLARARAQGCAVTNTPDVLTEATADLTWALLLSAARNVVAADAFTRSGAWQAWQLQGFLGVDFGGKTLGVVGFGRIGQAVARRAQGFGMQVLYSDPSAPPAHGARPVPLDELLATAHFVCLHMPLTPATHHLIDAAALARMRPEAVLVNVARGPVVDEAALVEALRSGRLRAAGFDVYEHEPRLSPGLAALPNVVLLPHLGSATQETRARMCEMSAEAVLAVIQGREPANRVA